VPRRKTKSDEQLIEPTILMLPPAKPRHHEHPIDAYPSLPGAVPHAEVLSLEPLKRKLTKAEKEQRGTLVSEQRMRQRRYDRYLAVLADTYGNRIAALATVFGVTEAEAEVRALELHTELKEGIGTSTVADEIERNDLGVSARAAVLRKHLYSSNPAASLKAADMVSEMEGDRQDLGSFESYLRQAKLQKG
jgi:hypothetical protein